MCEIVSLGGLETLEEMRFNTGVIPIPSPWSRKTEETTFPSSSSPTQGTASRYSKHDCMHEIKPSSSATCKEVHEMHKENFLKVKKIN